MSRCTFKDANWNCGSFAFNLAREGIKQGELCDRHYWQVQATKACADSERYRFLRVHLPPGTFYDMDVDSPESWDAAVDHARRKSCS
jgi:hypothetical protein